MTNVKYFHKLTIDLSIARTDERIDIDGYVLWTDKSSKGDPGIFSLKFNNLSPSSDTLTVNNDLNITSKAVIKELYISNDAQDGKFINLYWSSYITPQFNIAKTTTSSSNESLGKYNITVHTPTVDISPVGTFTEVISANPDRKFAYLLTHKSIIKKNSSGSHVVDNYSSYQPNDVGSENIINIPNVIWGTEAIMASSYNSTAVNAADYLIVEATEGNGNIVFFTPRIYQEQNSSYRTTLLNNNPNIKGVILQTLYSSSASLQLYGSYTGGNLIDTIPYLRFVYLNRSGSLYARLSVNNNNISTKINMFIIY